MDPISEVIVTLAKPLGVSPVAIALLIALIPQLATRIARLIPDTATGWLKYVRIACVVLGMYVKDNSGVRAKVDAEGAVTRQTTVEHTPEPVEPEIESEQGILLLDQPHVAAAEMPIDMFRKGAARIAERNQFDAG